MSRDADKRAIIVGAASGIGRAGAHALAQRGWSLGLIDIAEAPLHTLAGELGAHSAVADASDAVALARALAAMLDELAGVDAVWSNVGMQTNGNVLDTPVEAFDACYALNVRAHFVCAQTVIPALARRRGALLLTASNAGLQAESEMVAYATTKAATVALARNLARDHARQGVRVNALCPGFVDTPFNTPVWETFGGRDAFVAQIAETIPLGRMASAEEVAAQAAFLLSSDAAFITGQVLVADGGELLF